MTMKRLYKIPVTNDQGNCEILGVANGSETTRENALWEYNSMREHDGQPPVSDLPIGTTSEVIEESS